MLTRDERDFAKHVPIKIKHRLPLRPGLEHRRLYRRLGLLPEVFELC